MQKRISKKVIIQLIKDDLKHQQIILGLNILGFKYGSTLLETSKAIFLIMNLNIYDKRLEHLPEEYAERTYRITEIAIKDSKSFERLAIEIYNWLASERKKYLRLLKES